MKRHLTDSEFRRGLLVEQATGNQRQNFVFTRGAATKALCSNKGVAAAWPAPGMIVPYPGAAPLLHKRWSYPAMSITQKFAVLFLSSPLFINDLHQSLAATTSKSPMTMSFNDLAAPLSLFNHIWCRFFDGLAQRK
jgi:hypothetical protein